jgi:NitT/TauT family transport system permease protein
MSKKSGTINLKFRIQINRWDYSAFFLLILVIFAIGWAAKNVSVPFSEDIQPPIDLAPWHLFGYALDSSLRMAIAMLFSLLFTFIFGTWAAKSRQAEKVIIPTLDILQSVPVLSFLAITVSGFLALFPGSLWGPEFASIFAIFTAQVWNMTLSFYQSLSSIPKDLADASRHFRLSSWQRFWKVEVPFATPSLIWNMMMSMSGGWFFLVASEAISVNNYTIKLPGIGSYIAVAIDQSNTLAIGYAILAMIVVILAFDQIIFRPLVKWSEKFNMGETNYEQGSSSWLLDLINRSPLAQLVINRIRYRSQQLVNLAWLTNKNSEQDRLVAKKTKGFDWFSWLILILSLAAGAYFIQGYLLENLAWGEIAEVIGLGLLTGSRILVMIILCSLLWLPVGVWIGFRPRIVQKAQPVVQLLAAFPAPLVFPLFTWLILSLNLDFNLWCSILIILGTQWYILFNVIAGAQSMPTEFRLVAKNLNLKGWLLWRRVIMPAIFPYYITGAITASGGAWNASIVAEVVHWGHHHLVAEGLGAYIARAATIGDMPRNLLGVAIMSLLVILTNRLFWRRLYLYAQTRFAL